MGAVSVSHVRVAINSTARMGCAMAASLVNELRRLNRATVNERLDAYKRSGVGRGHVPSLALVRAVLSHIALRHHVHDNKRKRVPLNEIGYYDDTNTQACDDLWISESAYKDVVRFLEWTGALQTLVPATNNRAARRRLYPEYLDPKRAPQRRGVGAEVGTSETTQETQASRGRVSPPSKSVSNTPRTQDVAAHGATSLRFHDPDLAALYGLDIHHKQETEPQ